MLPRSVYQTAVTLVILFSTTLLASELIVNGQNEARYGRGEAVDQTSEDSYNYFENYLELNFALDKFRMYLRQTYLLPSIPELGERRQAGLQAFDNRYIEYRGDHLTLRGGDFFRSWGRGLLFGTTELIDLNFDNGLEGLLVESSYDRFDAALFRGVEVDSGSVFFEEAEGAWLSYWTPYKVRLGGIYMRMDETVRHPGGIDRRGFEVESSIGPASLYTAYVSDEVGIKIDDEITGTNFHHGLYSAADVFGMTGDLSWAILLEYKNYELFIFDENRLGIINNPNQVSSLTQEPSLQFPPTVMPEATMYLLDRHPRIQHFDDEVGYQLELTVNYQDWEAQANYNLSSSQGGSAVLPKLEEHLSPYWGSYLVVSHDNLDGDYFAVKVGGSEDVEFTPNALGGFSLWLRRIASGGIYEHRFKDVYSLSGDFEIMWEENKNADERFLDEYFAVSFSKSPVYSFTAMIERTDKYRDQPGDQDRTFPGQKWDDDHRFWPSGELTLNLFERHQFRIFGGYERGGLKCSGGVCRWVNPFKGVKLTLTSQF